MIGEAVDRRAKRSSTEHPTVDSRCAIEVETSPARELAIILPRRNPPGFPFLLFIYFRETCPSEPSPSSPPRFPNPEPSPVKPPQETRYSIHLASRSASTFSRQGGLQQPHGSYPTTAAGMQGRSEGSSLFTPPTWVPDSLAYNDAHMSSRRTF